MLGLSQQNFVTSRVQPLFANERLNRRSGVSPLLKIAEGTTRSIAEFGGLQLKVSDSRSEREQAFKLVHRVYSRSGLTDENGTGMRVLRQHLASTTDVIVAKQNGKTVYTVSLVGDGEYGLPLESLFEHEVNEMRNAGLRLAEISCLATDLDAGDKRGRFETFVKVIGLLLQTARHRGIDRLLLAVHPRHAKVYERMFGCVRCTEAREYASVKGNPAILCTHDFAALDRTGFPLLEQLYAHRYPSWQMEGEAMTEVEKVYFEQFLPVGEYEVEPMAA
jgi:hypothetical protein